MFYHIQTNNCKLGNSAGIVTRQDNRGILVRFHVYAEIFASATVSTLALVSIQLPVQWIPEVRSPEVKLPAHAANTHFPFIAEY
jgi:hypothetical protein